MDQKVGFNPEARDQNRQLTEGRDREGGSRREASILFHWYLYLQISLFFMKKIEECLGPFPYHYSAWHIIETHPAIISKREKYFNLYDKWTPFLWSWKPEAFPDGFCSDPRDILARTTLELRQCIFGRMTSQGAPTTPSMTHSRQATWLTSYLIFKSFELWFLAHSAIALLPKQVCGSNTDEINPPGPLSTAPLCNGNITPHDFG